MNRYLLLLASIIIFAFSPSEKSSASDETLYISGSSPEQDTIPESQLFFNGRIRRHLYATVVGDEFLFTEEWIRGDVVINDITFRNVPVRYDIYNDELISMINSATFIQLNKELVKGFTITFENKKYYFENFGDETGSALKGYGQVLYRGKVCLVLKQTKLIKELAVDNKFDKFYETSAIYILKENAFHRISGKREFLNLFSDKKEQLQKYIKENKITVSRKFPESFIRVMSYYDTI